LGSAFAIAISGAHSEAAEQRAPVDLNLEGWELASLTKPIVGTLAAALHLSGAIPLGTAVGDLVPDLRGEVRRATIGQLASHTSGLPRFGWSRDVPSPRKQPYERYVGADLEHVLESVALKRAGEFTYSNLGYLLLSHAFETAMDAPIFQLLDDHVGKHLGWEPCGWSDSATGVRWRRRRQRWIQPLAGPGGLQLSSADLRRWLIANVSPSSTGLREPIELAQAIYRAGRPATGLGWIHASATGVVQRGRTPTAAGCIAVDAARSRGVLVISNVGDRARTVPRLAQHLANHLPDPGEGSGAP